MKFVSLLFCCFTLQPYYVVSTKNAKVELMLIVSSEIRSSLDGTSGNLPDRYAKTKEYFMDIFEQMQSLFYLLDIELILFDFIIQNDDKVFGQDLEDISLCKSMNATLTLEKLTKHAHYTTRSSQPDARLFFLPFHKLEVSATGRTTGRVVSLHSVCNDDAFGIVSTDKEDKHRTAWTATHELGHILGAVHSNQLDCLENNGYGVAYYDEDGNHRFNLTKDYFSHDFVMHSINQAYDSQQIKQSGNWSECSRSALSTEELWNNTKHSIRPHCVFEESPVKDVLNEPVCGNGMIEEGEDCDSGLCCSGNCTFLPNYTKCGSSSEKFCSGDNQECPEWRPYVRQLSVITWSGDDCPQEVYKFIVTARLLISLGLFILLGACIRAVVVLARLVNVFIVFKPDEQPNKEAETFLA